MGYTSTDTSIPLLLSRSRRKRRRRRRQYLLKGCVLCIIKRGSLRILPLFYGGTAYKHVYTYTYTTFYLCNCMTLIHRTTHTTYSKSQVYIFIHTIITTLSFLWTNQPTNQLHSTTKQLYIYIFIYIFILWNSVKEPIVYIT